MKKTVNQDDVSAYHLFYGDELGRPGTGTISTIALGVTGRDVLDGWVKRFDEDVGASTQSADYARVEEAAGL